MQVESEVLKEHTDQILHVSFSHNGQMFATSSKEWFCQGMFGETMKQLPA